MTGRQKGESDMRAKLLGILCTLLVGMFMPMAAQAVTDCEKSEQTGCIELDILNLKWDQNHPEMVGLREHHGDDQDERYRRVTELGPLFYQEYKKKRVQSAGSRTFRVFIWDPVEEIDVDRISSYRLHKNGRLTRNERTTELDQDVFQARFTDPMYDLGPPDRTFELMTDGPGAAIQFPWEVIGPSTYVLICTFDEETVYPNRIDGRDEGLWITPEYFESARQRGWEYMLLPFLSLS
jgi:hypothetical protein